MVSLSQVHAKDAEVSTQRARLNTVQTELYQKESYTDGLDKQIGQTIDKLATLYLPALNAGVMDEVPAEVKRTVETFYQQKNNRITQLEDLLSMSARHIGEFELENKTALADLEQAQKTYEAKEDAYENMLNEHVDYKRLRQEMLDADANLEVATKLYDERVKRREKIQATYLSDKFFKKFYDLKMHERGEDTFSRRLNRIFANYYGYGERKKRFDLQDAELWEAEQQLKTAREKSETTDVPVKELEQQLTEQSGRDAAAQALELATKNVQTAQKNLEKTQNDHAAYRAERSELETNQGVFYRQAMQSLVGRVKGMDMNTLKALARSTPSPEDDGLVDRLESLYSDLNAADVIVKSLRQKASSEQSVLSSLENERSRLHNAYVAEQEEIARRRREEERRRREAEEERRRAARRREESYRSSYSGSSSSSSFGGGFGGGGSSVGGSF